jgi:hypothetical protein
MTVEQVGDVHVERRPGCLPAVGVVWRVAERWGDYLLNIKTEETLGALRSHVLDLGDLEDAHGEPPIALFLSRIMRNGRIIISEVGLRETIDGSWSSEDGELFIDPGVDHAWKSVDQAQEMDGWLRDKSGEVSCRLLDLRGMERSVKVAMEDLRGSQLTSEQRKKPRGGLRWFQHAIDCYLYDQWEESI